VKAVVSVDRLGEIDAEPINVELFDERSGTADKKVSHDFFPVPGSEAGGAIVYVTAVWVWMVGRFPFVPIIDVLLRRVGVILPLVAGRIEEFMSFTSVVMPQTFGAEGPSSRTPQRNVFPTSRSSNSTVAIKQGQPSSA
jgi:hypothetical protein